MDDKTKILEQITDLIMDDRDYLFFGTQDGMLTIGGHGKPEELVSLISQCINDYPKEFSSTVVLASVCVATLTDNNTSRIFRKMIFDTEAKLKKKKK